MSGARQLTFETRVAGAAEARVAFHVEGADPASLTGAVDGPHCRLTRTLPATYAVTGGSVAIPEPCSWSPALPHRYHVRLTGLTAGGEPIELEEPFAIRRLSVGPRIMTLDGRGFVVRAWHTPAKRPIDAIDWASLREHALSLWVDSAAAVEDLEALLEAAEEHGVFVAGDVPADRYASALAVPADRQLGWPVESAAIEGPHFAARLASDLTTAAVARRACERLQADCAPHTDLAGYVV